MANKRREIEIKRNDVVNEVNTFIIKSVLYGVGIGVTMYGVKSYFYRNELDGIDDNRDAEVCGEEEDSQDSEVSEEVKEQKTDDGEEKGSEVKGSVQGDKVSDGEEGEEWYGIKLTDEQMKRLTDNQRKEMERLKASEEKYKKHYKEAQKYIRTHQPTGDYLDDFSLLNKRISKKIYEIRILEKQMERKKLIGDEGGIEEMKKKKLSMENEKLKIEGEKFARVLQDIREYISTHPETEIKTEKDRRKLLFEKMNEKFFEADILKNKADILRNEAESGVKLKYGEVDELMKQYGILRDEGNKFSSKMHNLRESIIPTSKLSEKDVTMKGFNKAGDRTYFGNKVKIVHNSDIFKKVFKAQNGYQLTFCTPVPAEKYTPAIFSGEDTKIIHMCVSPKSTCCPNGSTIWTGKVLEALDYFDSVGVLSLIQGNTIYTNYDGLVEYSSGIDEAIIDNQEEILF